MFQRMSNDVVVVMLIVHVDDNKVAPSTAVTGAVVAEIKMRFSDQISRRAYVGHK